MQDHYGEWIATTTIEQYREKLQACGWLDEISEREKEDVGDNLEAVFETDRRYSFAVMAAGLIDAKCIYDLNQVELSYGGAIQEIADMTYGAFQPYGMVNRLVLAQEQPHIWVSFEAAGQHYECTVADSEVFQLEVLALINQALADGGCDRQFFVLPAFDQCLYFAFMSQAVYDRACELKLIPSLDYFGRDFEGDRGDV